MERALGIQLSDGAEHRLLAQHIDEYAAVYRELFERREELERERLQRVEKFFPNL